MLMQNFGVTNKEHYGMLWYFWSGQYSKALAKAKKEAFEGSVKKYLSQVTQLLL